MREEAPGERKAGRCGKGGGREGASGGAHNIGERIDVKMKMKKLLAVLLSVCMLAMLAVPAFAQEAADGAEQELKTFSIEVTYGQTEAREMLEMINEFRTGDDNWEWNEDSTEKVYHQDLGELSYDYGLEQVAMQRAAEIVVLFSHTRPNGASCFSIYEEIGYNWTALGENIAAGYSSAESVFEGWKETNEDYDGQGHRRNMLSESFTAVGIAHVIYEGRDYWVQEFGNPTTGEAYTEPNDSPTTVQIEATAEIADQYIGEDDGGSDGEDPDGEDPDGGEEEDPDGGESTGGEGEDPDSGSEAPPEGGVDGASGLLAIIAALLVLLIGFLKNLFF